MWSSEREMKNGKIIALSDARYYYEEKKKPADKKFSSVMAMILGFLVTLEIMVAGAMIFNIDFHTADTLAVIFSFAVVYFAVVAGLTDK